MTFISHIKTVYSEQNFAQVGAERQTIVHTHTNTHFSENNFSKQVCTHS